MRTWWTMYQHEEASLPVEWFNPATGLLFDFSSGYTFLFQLVSLDVIKYTDNTGIVGFATSPNIIVGIGAGELATTTPGLYLALITAHKTSTSTDMIFEQDDPPILEVKLTPA